MRWRSGRQSENVEDRRGSGSKVPGGAKGLGLGAIVLVVIGALFGIEPGKVMALLGGAQSAAAPAGGGGYAPGEDPDPELTQFVKTVFGYTEDVWNEQFRQGGGQYQEPTLVVFEDAVQSACGTQGSEVGPFYCPADSNVYIDLGFFRQLKNQLGAPGDFAQAYVIAHEVGHHIQNILGRSSEVHQAKRGMSKEEANQLSVRLELQADFYAGVWAHHADKLANILEKGDVEEAMNAAKRIGDDALQRQATGRVRPESFTHGTSEQRQRWFYLGLKTGDMRRGEETFSVNYRDL